MLTKWRGFAGNMNGVLIIVDEIQSTMDEIWFCVDEHCGGNKKTKVFFLKG